LSFISENAAGVTGFSCAAAFFCLFKPAVGFRQYRTGGTSRDYQRRYPFLAAFECP
jgi:hypothetical protein